MYTGGYTGFFPQGGNWIGGDNSKRGTVFIYIFMFSVHVQLYNFRGGIYQGDIPGSPLCINPGTHTTL